MVTGASKGIGRAIAEWLGNAGSDIAVNYRSSTDAAAETVERVESAGDWGSAIVVQADVTNVEAVEAMRDRVHDEFGRIDILVNNAGVPQTVKFTEMTHEDWDTVLDVHLVGPFHCMQLFYDDLPDRLKDQLREDTPLGPMDTVEEIAAVVAFLASDRSSFITGEIIDANGGKGLPARRRLGAEVLGVADRPVTLSGGVVNDEARDEFTTPLIEDGALVVTMMSGTGSFLEDLTFAKDVFWMQGRTTPIRHSRLQA